MTHTDIGWEPRLAPLVTTLVDAGHLHTREWIEPFADTPRHLFTPQALLNTLDGYRQISGNNSSDHDEWLSAGQWAWLAEECGLPIAEAIADELTGDDR